MPHVIETATSGRSRCRGCGNRIGKAMLRFGEGLPSPYSDGGELTVWYHLECAAYRRPEPFLIALAATGGLPEAARLRAAAELSRSHHRVCRIGGVERASSGRARCRACRELIDRHGWRIPLVFHEEGLYSAAGFVHLHCAAVYFGTTALLDCVRRFSADLPDSDLAELAASLH